MELPTVVPTFVPDLSGKRALVTGAAGGLGAATARALALRGAQVILADRDLDRTRELARQIGDTGGRAHALALDLADLGQVRAAATAVGGEGPLDLLIMIAGILPPERRATTADGFELKFGINVLGHFALAAHLLPALLQSPEPRVVGISSITHRRARIDFEDLQGERRYESQRAYGQAKLACLMLAVELAQRARAAGAPLVSVAAHPGIARTNIGQERRGMPHATWRGRIETWALRAAMRWLGQPADRGAWPILYAATAADVVNGGYYGPDGWAEFAGAPCRLQPAAHALDPLLRTRLWSACESLTQARYDWGMPVTALPSGR